MELQELIGKIREIDIYKVIEQNPRRPFDNEMTCRLLLDEVIKIINREFSN